MLHAAQQDLEVLTHACGAVPARLFDTQLVAGFLGHSTPSLSSLVSGELQIRLPKADRLTDWLRRPLSEDQKTYAASDVAHLFELYDGLAAQLEELGRLDWALAECEELRTRPVGPSDPDDAWLRLKDVRTLKRHARGVAEAVAAWRERRAARTGHAGPLGAARPGGAGHRPAAPRTTRTTCGDAAASTSATPAAPCRRRSWRRWRSGGSTRSTFPIGTRRTWTARCGPRSRWSRPG